MGNTTKIPSRLCVPGIRFVLVLSKAKKPFEQEWQKKNIPYNAASLELHMKKGGNYGVMGGGEKNLLIVDFDQQKVQDEIVEKLPETFTVRTGSGMLHKYFFSDASESFKIFDEEMNTLVDVQGEGKQAIGPESIHPNGNAYELIEDKDIAFIPYAELKALLTPYDKKPQRTQPPPPQSIPSTTSNDKNTDQILDDILAALPMSRVLDSLGVDTRKNPTACPLHGSKGGKCMGFDDKTAHCFHCEGRWNALSIVKDVKHLGAKDAIDYLAYLAGMYDELKEARRQYREQQSTQENIGDIVSEVSELLLAKAKNEATELLVKYIRDHYHIYTTRDDTKEEVWIYNEGLYVPHGKTYIAEICRTLLGQLFNQTIVKEVIFKIESDTFIDQQTFFANNHVYEIPVRNGILHILDRTLSPFTPEKIFFTKLPVHYNPHASCPRIDTFLTQVLASPEDKLVYYEMGGFALVKEYLFEKAFMMVGGGRNGKGKALELIKRVVGPENCYSLPLAALTSDNADVSQLFGKLVNLAGDIGHAGLKETHLFKGLTGRDIITTKRKYLSALSFQNYAKFIFACNILPMVYDHAKGFWDRWILLKFPFYFTNQQEIDRADPERRPMMRLRDESIIEKITTPEELSGLLNKFLEGLDRLMHNHRFSNTLGTEETKMEWMRMASSFLAFCEDHLEEDYTSKISKRELRQAYATYCRKHKIKGQSDTIIKRTLEEVFGATDQYVGDFGSQEWGWVGIRWK